MAETIRLGLLRLCDAAPVILADHEEMFAINGVRVTLSVELWPAGWRGDAAAAGHGLRGGPARAPH